MVFDLENFAVTDTKLNIAAVRILPHGHTCDKKSNYKIIIIHVCGSMRTVAMFSLVSVIAKFSKSNIIARTTHGQITF